MSYLCLPQSFCKVGILLVVWDGDSCSYCSNSKQSLCRRPQLSLRKTPEETAVRHVPRKASFVVKWWSVLHMPPATHPALVHNMRLAHSVCHFQTITLRLSVWVSSNTPFHSLAFSDLFLVVFTDFFVSFCICLNKF